MVARWEIMGEIGKVRKPTPITAHKRRHPRRALTRAIRQALDAAKRAWAIMETRNRAEWR